jgi:hypothetical protein
MIRPPSTPSAGALALALLAAAAAAPLAAQTPDYQRAERFLNWNASDLIAGDQVNPTWLPDGHRFWYRNKTGGGSEFVIVDPVRNLRAPAFDHARLAAAMSLAADTSYIGNKLPFTTFDFEDGERAIAFNASKKRFT